MTKLKLLSATAILAALDVRPYMLPYEISYKHNYGPGRLPGTFAYYDGPATVHCAQSAAAYVGQDGRRYPCN